MQKRAIATRKKLLDTGVKIFAAKGYHGTTVDDLSRGAGVNKQRVYAYFGSKKGLWKECLRYIFSDMEKINAEICRESASAPADLTEIILNKYMSVHRRNPDFRRLLSWTNLEPDADIDNLPFLEEGYSGLRSAFAAAQSAGAVPEKLSFEVYIFLLMSISYFWNSNRKTLAKTLSGALFSSGGQEQIIRETAEIFRNGTDSPPGQTSD